MSQRLHQQPAGVAARPARETKRLVRRLHARLETNDVRNLLRQLRVEIDEEIDRPSWAPIDRPDELLEWRAVGAHLEERREVFLQPRLVGERELLGGRLEEEVERIEDRHLRDEIDFDEQLTRLLRETRHAPR